MSASVSAEPGPQPVAVRARPACRHLDPPAIERAARRDEGARRAPPGRALPLSATPQTYGLPEAGGRDARRRDARMFDGASDTADERAFAERRESDRHDFRFIISPEDGAEPGNLKTFTRELMLDVERDLWREARLGGGRPLEYRGGVADLRPGPNAEDPELRRLLLGRATKLERLGPADPGPAGTPEAGPRSDSPPARHLRRHHQDQAPGDERRWARTGCGRLRSAWRGALRSGAWPAGQAGPG